MKYELRGIFRDGCVDVDRIDHGWRVSVTLKVPDVDDGEPTVVESAEIWHREDPPPPDFVAAVFRKAALHEARESLFVDGRMFDNPHEDAP